MAQAKGLLAPLTKAECLANPTWPPATGLALILPFLVFSTLACGGNDPDDSTGTTGATATGNGATGTAATGNAATSGATTSNATMGVSDSTSSAAGGASTASGTTTDVTSDAGSGGNTTTSNITGSTTGAGGGGGSIDDLPETDCTVSVMTSEIAEIATVGVVTFSADLPAISRAEVQFGKDESYGLAAPVDLGATDYRTLLLGMTENSSYNYRVAVSDGSQVCYGDNQTIETGSLDVDGLDDVNVGEGTPSGFIVTSRGGDVIIFNEAGELVWGYPFGGRLFSAQMSWDGQTMIGRDVGPFDAANGGTFRRMGMDGSGAMALDAPGGDHHDFAPIPGGIAYLAKTAAGDCDQIFIASDAITDGEPLVDTWEIFQYFSEPEGMGGGQGELCHANRIHYIADAELFTVSDRNKDALAVFDRAGAPVTSIGSTPSGGWTQHIQAEGTGSDWRVQHGHHFYAEDKLLVFSNNGSSGSAMLHYTINGGSAALDWSYADAGQSMTQGDVQHLPNGTFLVTASNAGMMHLIDAQQNLISSYSAGGEGGGTLGGFGYAWFRTTLYGPPPSRP